MTRLFWFDIENRFERKILGFSHCKTHVQSCLNKKEIGSSTEYGFIVKKKPHIFLSILHYRLSIKIILLNNDVSFSHENNIKTAI
jgi:hypothetical protein